MIEFVQVVKHPDRPVLANGVTLAGADASQAGAAVMKTSISPTTRVFIAKPLDRPTTSAIATTSAVVPAR